MTFRAFSLTTNSPSHLPILYKSHFWIPIYLGKDFGHRVVSVFERLLADGEDFGAVSRELPAEEDVHQVDLEIKKVNRLISNKNCQVNRII